MGNRFYTTTLEERFCAKVQKGPGCWIWTGSSDKDGYGQIREAGRGSPLLKAHRVSWEMVNGPIPEGLCLRHRCDNPPCVRPDHLTPGTLAQNNQDTASRGRQFYQVHPEHCPRGEKASGAKLTQVQVDEIRALRKQGYTQCRLAAQFGVTQANISMLLLGKTWADRGSVRASPVLFE